MSALRAVDAAFVDRLRVRGTTPSGRTVRASDLIVAAGITYRQCDWWVRTGRLHPVGHATPGSGIPRRFPAGEVHVATLVRRLTSAGLGVDEAFTAARRLVLDRLVLLGNGLLLVVDEERTGGAL